MDKETHLNLRQVPEDLLPALENHMSEIDAVKKASGAQPRLVPEADQGSSTEVGVLACSLAPQINRVLSCQPTDPGSFCKAPRAQRERLA